MCTKKQEKCIQIRSLWSNVRIFHSTYDIKHCDNEKKKHKFYFMKLKENKNNEHKIETQKSF